MSSLTGTRLFLILCSLLSALAAGDPIQFCKPGSRDHPNEDIDFCMSLTSSHNSTTHAHDIYLTMTHKRYNASALGWTAIGAGQTMTGALMFIIYGNPLSGEDPIVSIRGATGHHQPTLIDQSTSGGLNMRVTHAEWSICEDAPVGDHATYMATINVACYSCEKWPGAPIRTHATSMPWMWAWNGIQEFDEFANDAHLKMHKHHAEEGGWGNFYLDMSKSGYTGTGIPISPPIQPSVLAISATETQSMSILGSITEAARRVINPMWHLHGLLMGSAFLIFFPAGVVMMRSGSPKAFEGHWTVQLVASTITALGILAGLLLNARLNTVHQVMGAFIAATLLLQSILGWRHHMRFIKIRERSWISYSHIWLGRLLMLGGWCNLATGLMLRRYPSYYVVIIVLIASIEVILFSAWQWLKNRKQKHETVYTPAWSKEEEEGSVFALSDEDELEEDAESEQEKEKLIPGKQRKTAGNALTDG